MHPSDPHPFRQWLRPSAASTGAIVLAGVVLSGCSEVPDYANPVEWYNSAVSVFDDEEPATEAVDAGPVPGENQPFPNLSTVPEAPPRTATLAELETVAEGLAADREHARYTDEDIAAEPPVPAPAAELPATAASTESVVSAPAPPSPIAALPAQPVAASPTPAVPAPQPVAARQPVSTPSIAAAPPAPAVGAAGGEVDVRTLFTKLFNASGPRAVAPADEVTIANYAPPAPVSAPTPAPVPTPAPAPAAGTAPLADVATAPGLDRVNGGVSTASSAAAVVYFNKGSATLTRDGRKALRKVLKLHKERGGTVRVVGHASSRTRELTIDRHRWVNFEISLERARSVAKELIRLGIPTEAILVNAISDREPVYYEWMPSGEAGNRRAEIFLDF